MPRFLLVLLSTLAWALAGIGCAHYQLGTGSKVTFATLYVEPVDNQTMIPQSQPLLSSRLREAFVRDGRVALANSPDTADATLTVIINQYTRDIAAVREGDTGLARKFNVTLGASCSLRDNRTGRMIFVNRPVTAMREVFTDSGLLNATGSGLLQSEYQTLPILGEALAARITHAALDVW